MGGVSGCVLASAVWGVKWTGGAVAAFRSAQGQWGHVEKPLTILLATFECIRRITSSSCQAVSLWLPLRRWPVSDVEL